MISLCLKGKGLRFLLHFHTHTCDGFDGDGARYEAQAVIHADVQRGRPARRKSQTTAAIARMWEEPNTHVPSFSRTGAGHRRYVSLTTRGRFTVETEASPIKEKRP